MCQLGVKTAELKDRTEKLSAAEKEIAVLTEKERALSKALSEAQADANEKKSQLLELTKERDSLKDQLDAKTLELANTTKELGEKQRALEETGKHAKEEAAAGVGVAELHRQLDELRETEEEDKKKLETLEADFLRLTRETEDKNSEFNNLQEQNRQLAELKHSWEVKYQHSEAALKKLQAEHKALRSEAEQLEEEKEKLQKELEEKDTDSQELQRTLEKLKRVRITGDHPARIGIAIPWCWSWRLGWRLSGCHHSFTPEEVNGRFPFHKVSEAISTTFFFYNQLRYKKWVIFLYIFRSFTIDLQSLS